MSLFITSLNSGSNGNCYFIGNEHEAVLIDVGISCREIEKRMARLELSMDKVKAIFITHEHADHIRGVVVLARKYQLPVYITPSTLKSSPISLEQELVRTFTADEPVAIGSLLITGFTKLHDAAEPHSFIVEGNGVKIGILTDIGAPCERVIHYFKQCNAVFLEANYDDEMLENGRYPFYLKERIRGGKGHLSNKQALDLFRDHKPAFMTHVLLSHLSKDNNSPEVAAALFQQYAGKTSVIVASRYSETEVYAIVSNVFQVNKRRVELLVKPEQLSLF
ncbi:MAG: MBL fold metallo-hydrolase [Bacteroidota bacterium]